MIKSARKSEERILSCWISMEHPWTCRDKREIVQKFKELTIKIEITFLFSFYDLTVSRTVPLCVYLLGKKLFRIQYKTVCNGTVEGGNVYQIKIKRKHTKSQAWKV